MKNALLRFGAIVFIASGLIACAELKSFVKEVTSSDTVAALTQTDIANGLKEALTQGIDQQVTKLTGKNGFYGNDLARIALPKELQKVDKQLRKIGLGKLADDGIKSLNHAAEDAVGRSKPIFVDAIKNMSFSDAKNILMGDERSATSYLEKTTNEKLYTAFLPEIQQSFDRVGANDTWGKIISTYNAIPLVEKMNPNLSDYVTQEALNGVYSMIAVEEKNIRTDFSSRTSSLLKRVFALQDQ